MAVGKFLRGVLKKEPASESNSASTSSGAKLELITDSPKLSGQQSSKAFYLHVFQDSTQQPLSVPQKLVIDVVRENLVKADYRASAVPRIPTVIPKLVRSLRDPDSSVRDYVNIVNKDPVMSAAVLKLGNSVYFNPIGARINDIERAIVKLGIDGLRSVLSAAVMQPIIQRESNYFSQTGQRLWQHSLNTAVACEIIGHARRQERFKVYLMGLVHDIGKITLFSELCKQFKLNGDSAPGRQAFTLPMMKLSNKLSYLIAKDWQLPDEICLALQEQINIGDGAKVSTYGKILYHANIACEAYAITTVKNREKLDFLIEDLELPRNLFNKLVEVSTQL